VHRHDCEDYNEISADFCRAFFAALHGLALSKNFTAAPQFFCHTISFIDRYQQRFDSYSVF
jgi:hypothetical protein